MVALAIIQMAEVKNIAFVTPIKFVIFPLKKNSVRQNNGFSKMATFWNLSMLPPKRVLPM